MLSEKARAASRIPWNLTADDVQAWMDLQSIDILKNIYKVHKNAHVNFYTMTVKIFLKNALARGVATGATWYRMRGSA